MNFGSSDIVQMPVLAGTCFAIIHATEWCLLPMAIFGVKPKLDAIREAIRTSNKLFEESVKIRRTLQANVGTHTEPHKLS